MVKLIVAAILLLATVYGVSAQTGHICTKYSELLGVTNLELIGDIVTKLANAALGSPSLAIYFNGVKPPGSTNFTDPAKEAAFNALATNLISFFALPVAFNCSDGTIGAYAGVDDMFALHQPMMISAADSAAFNDAVVAIMDGKGVDADDLTATRALLDSFNEAIIFQGTPSSPMAPTGTPMAGTPTAGTPTSAPTKASSAAAVGASCGFMALAALF